MVGMKPDGNHTWHRGLASSCARQRSRRGTWRHLHRQSSRPGRYPCFHLPGSGSRLDSESVKGPAHEWLGRRTVGKESRGFETVFGRGYQLREARPTENAVRAWIYAEMTVVRGSDQGPEIRVKVELAGVFIIRGLLADLFQTPDEVDGGRQVVRWRV